MTAQPKKILVGMSGGVDSSVAAALLVEQGHDVIGGFMKNWSSPKDDSGVCTWKQDYRDAGRVAAQLGIELHFFDFEKQYRKHVYDYMIAEYKKGRTPNPDVLCNQYMKFGYFMQAAQQLGCDHVATGHYAGVRDGHLLRAKDEGKDQTYFLHRLTQEQLKHALFPLKDLTKKEVRAKAAELNLPTKDKEESMGICFVGEVSIKEFLQKEIKPQPGEVVNEHGKHVGEHEGLPFYTIGQRHGFTQAGGADPYYVAQKDFERNRLIVAHRESELLLKKEAQIEDLYWIAEPAKECLVRLRHRGALVKAQVKPDKIIFDKSQWGVTPGQFAVLYSDTECLGGGVIM